MGLSAVLVKPDHRGRDVADGSRQINKFCFESASVLDVQLVRGVAPVLVLQLLYLLAVSFVFSAVRRSPFSGRRLSEMSCPPLRQEYCLPHYGLRLRRLTRCFLRRIHAIVLFRNFVCYRPYCLHLFSLHILVTPVFLLRNPHCICR